MVAVGYLDEGVPAVQGLLGGQRLGHLLQVGLEGRLGQALLQHLGVHLSTRKTGGGGHGSQASLCFSSQQLKPHHVGHYERPTCDITCGCVHPPHVRRVVQTKQRTPYLQELPRHVEMRRLDDVTTVHVVRIGALN